MTFFREGLAIFLFFGGRVEFFWVRLGIIREAWLTFFREGFTFFREGLRFFWEGLRFFREGLRFFRRVEIIFGRGYDFFEEGGGRLRNNY